jgi:NAD(P)-dependent dehydrogenase (short-subunit alcohol dehydrogenase family)
LEIVKKLAAEQPNYHILLASRDPSKGSEADIAITGLAEGTSVSFIQLEVTSDASIASTFSEISTSFSKLNVLINNADVSHLGNPFLRSEMLAVYNTNTVSGVRVTEAFISLLSKSPVPRVIFMSSDLGSVTQTLDTMWTHYNLSRNIPRPYKCSKAAINMLGALYSAKYAEKGF